MAKSGLPGLPFLGSMYPAWYISRSPASNRSSIEEVPRDESRMKITFLQQFWVFFFILCISLCWYGMAAHIFVWCGEFFWAVTDDDIVCQREFCRKQNHSEEKEKNYDIVCQREFCTKHNHAQSRGFNFSFIKEHLFHTLNIFILRSL